MSFSGNPTKFADQAIGNDGFWPELSVAEFQKAYRLPGEYLVELLADVSVQRLRPDSEPADTGSVQGDLRAWAEQFHEEMSSEVGLGMIRDVLSTGQFGEGTGASRCSAFTASQIELMLERGRSRGEAVPTADAVMDGFVAPLMYRLVFGPAPATAVQAAGWITACLASAVETAD